MRPFSLSSSLGSLMTFLPCDCTWEDKGRKTEERGKMKGVVSIVSEGSESK